MTDDEKLEHPEWATTGGYLKEYEYEEAFQKSFDDLNYEEKIKQLEQLENLPNFDKEIFEEISGINIDEEKEKLNKANEILEFTMEELREHFGKEVKIKE